MLDNNKILWYYNIGLFDSIIQNIKRGVRAKIFKKLNLSDLSFNVKVHVKEMFLGRVTRENNMYCTKCGLKNEDNEKFCLFKV